MQTFLPSKDFAESARTLDAKRLGNQRREAKTLLNGGWPNHPASKMWRGYERALALYGVAISKEWFLRGYDDNQRDWFLAKARELPDTGLPHWLGDDDFHDSHRSNLMRKARVDGLLDWYGQFGWSVPDDLPYVWPKGRESEDEAR